MSASKRVLVLIAAFGVAYLWVPFTAWGDVSQELSIFFGLLAAALPQAMALTNQIQPLAHMNIAETDALVDRLEKQQSYWFSIFLLCGVGIVFLVMGKLLSSESMLGEDISILIPTATRYAEEYQLAPLFSGVVAAVCALLTGHLVGVGHGIISLQRLRSRFIRDAARKEIGDRLRRENSNAEPYEPDPKFGEVIRPSRGRQKKAG